MAHERKSADGAVPGFSRRMTPALRRYYSDLYPVFLSSLRPCFSGRRGHFTSLAAGQLPSAVADPARLYLARPGKFLRPLITAIILDGFGLRPRDFTRVFSAIEIMESATCSFDDIVDASSTRRGGPATHEVYGTATAYLAYQAAYNSAYAAFLSGPGAAGGRSNLDALAGEIFAYGYGQAAELYWSAKRTPPTVEQYLSMTWDRIRFLSFNGPFRVGALLGGADSARLRSFAEAGSWLGMAYHLRGDELNIFPASPEWGKPLADDITAGRYTVLTLGGLRARSAAERAAFRSAFARREVSGPALKNAINIIRSGGAPARNRELIRSFSRKAAAAIRDCGLPAAQTRLLLDLLKYMAYDRDK